MFIVLFYVVVFVVAALISGGILSELIGPAAFVLGLPIGGVAAWSLYNKQMQQRRERELAAPADPARGARPQTASPSTPRRPAADVFISYKREERNEIAAIAKRLSDLKLNVWFDADLRSGAAFDAEIDRQVRTAKAVLVCWSPGAVGSDWVRAESAVGRERGVLAAAMVKPCDLPTPFNLIHAEDLRDGVGPSNPQWIALLERIGALTQHPGLAAYEQLGASPQRFELHAWMATYRDDPLVDTAALRATRAPV